MIKDATKLLRIYREGGLRQLWEEEENLYDWLYVEENACYRADLQEWSGTRTMLADTPDGTYTPEWVQYISVSEGDDLL